MHAIMLCHHLRLMRCARPLCSVTVTLSCLLSVPNIPSHCDVFLNTDAILCSSYVNRARTRVRPCADLPVSTWPGWSILVLAGIWRGVYSFLSRCAPPHPALS
jgi:hypothetical protein